MAFEFAFALTLSEASSGQTVVVSDGARVFGFDGSDGTTLDVLAGASVDFTGSFVGDTVNIADDAAGLQARLVGTVLEITDGADQQILIPVSAAGDIFLSFGGGAPLALGVDGGVVTLGDQEITDSFAPITGEGTGGEPTEVSLDGQGNQVTPAELDADGDAFAFLDDVGADNFVNISNFGGDDEIRFSGTIGGDGVTLDDVTIDPGADTILTVNNAGTVSQITLVGVETGLSVQTAADFNALPDVGDIVIA